MPNRNTTIHQAPLIPVLFFAALLLIPPCGPLPSVQAQDSSDTVTLATAYDEALQAHELIRIVGKEIAKSRQLIRQANSIMLPHASVEGQYYRLDDTVTRSTSTHLSVPPLFEGDILVGPTETAPKEQYGVSVSIKQAIYEGRYFPLHRAASDKVQQSRENLLDTTQNVLFNVATVFYSAVSAKALLASAQEIRDWAKKDVNVAQIKFDAGKITEDAVHRARLNVTRAERQLITTKQQLIFAKETLARFMGRDTPPEDVEQPAIMAPHEEDLDVLLQQAYDNRHDYKAATLGIRLAEEDVKLVRSKFFPTVGAEVKQYWLNEETYTRDSQFWTAGVRLSLPLWEGGSRTAELAEKKETLAQARLTAVNLKKNIRLDVENARLAMITMTKVLENARQQVETASKNYEIVESQFSHGAATSLDLDQALTALDTAKTQLVNETFNEQIAILQLRKATGLFAKQYIEPPPRE